MKWRLALAISALAGGSVACGGSASPSAGAASPDGEGATTEAVELDPASRAEVVPSRCVVRRGACMPPVRWAERLCSGGIYQDLALYMFRSGTPWTRFYMRTGLNAVNGWGPTVAEELVSHEEVIPINYRGQSQSFHVEGSLGTFDVLRWNGSCVTLDAAEVTSRIPSSPRSSRVEWRSLSEPMQQALLADTEVERVYAARRRECKGATIGRVTKECEVLDHKLVDVVASYVRSVTSLPAPAEHP